MATQTITPDAHGIAVVILIVTALVLFTRDRLPLESSSLAVIVVLILGFHLFPYEADGVVVEPAQFLLGFGNEALVAICFVVEAAADCVATHARRGVRAECFR
jgi:uncharacterized membrane protein YGL010W